MEKSVLSISGVGSYMIKGSGEGNLKFILFLYLHFPVSTSTNISNIPLLVLMLSIGFNIYVHSSFRCSVLKEQLSNYKMLTNKRVHSSIPVITYQDNMQLMRTSLRHLWLSKLQQDKAKQNKFWDLTVRGFRVADISGIEDLFEDEKAVKAQQQDVDKLKYEDLKIGMGCFTMIKQYWSQRLNSRGRLLVHDVIYQRSVQHG